MNLVQGVESVASVSDGQINITIRKNISGITQRLGSITLAQDDDEEIELFQWTSISAQSAADAVTTISTLHSKLAEQQETIAKLNVQLDDLIKAKQEHEDILLQKFTELLNSKKLKIRDQQRLLAGARVDPSTAERVSEARSPEVPRRSKRKAGGKGKAKAVAEDEESDGFEDAPASKMDVDADTHNNDEDEDDRFAQMTPEASDTTEDDEEVPSRAPKQSLTEQVQQVQAAGASAPREETELPAPRDLPFQKKYLRSQKPSEEAKAHATPAVEDDEETDDEL